MHVVDDDVNINVSSFPATASAEAGAAGGRFGGSGGGLSTFAAEKEKKKKKSTPAATSGPRIATIHNMSKSSSEDEEEQGQAFYTGGSERSGQQILGPPRKNPIKDYVSEIFRSAQESGAEMVEQPRAAGSSAAATSSAAGGSFVGTGYRLGQTPDDHTALPDQLSRPSRPSNIEPVILKLWRQGFSINDGELRSYEEQANKDFLESIMKGLVTLFLLHFASKLTFVLCREIPAELRQQGGGSMVHVDLEDHRHEEYKRSTPKIQPFAGKGHTLGRYIFCNKNKMLFFYIFYFQQSSTKCNVGHIANGHCSSSSSHSKYKHN